MSRTRGGFTLVEVLIALLVVALGIGALLSTLVSSADAIGRLRDKSLAEWIALNRISEVRLGTRRPQVGVSTGTIEYAGQNWNWRQTVSDPGVAGMLRLDVAVTLAGTEAGEAGRFPAIATAYGFIGTAVGRATGIDPDWSLAAAARTPGSGSGTGGGTDAGSGTGTGGGGNPGAGTE